jgi:dTDP-4-dehydrorhamnose 3,5-epimerase
LSQAKPLPDGVRILTGNDLIEGVQIIPLRRIPDERGTIFHMLRRTDPHFIEFGEIYFATVYQNVIKGWHKHRDMTLNYTCISGRIKLVIYDDRGDSPTQGNLMEVYMGTDNHALAVIPPGVWNGFKGMSAPYSMVANCSTHPHDPSLSSRLDPFSKLIPYDWDVQHS